MLNQNKNIKIKFVKTWPCEEIVELYKAGGWWKDSYDPSGIEPLIKGSFAFAVAFGSNDGNAVGMGRILSDGMSDAYIQDVVVLKEYRGKGIGKKIVNFLLKHCISEGIIWIGLIAEPDQDDFYSQLGFQKMKNYVPMKYKLRR